MNNPKETVFVFDIDGTLYSHRYHELSRYSMDQIRRLKKLGYRIGIATSRSRAEMKHLPADFRDTDFDFYILEGGGLVLDGQKQPLLKKSISADQMDKILRYCQEHDLLLRASTEQNDFFNKKPDRSARAIMNHFYLSSPKSADLSGKEAYNLLIWADEEQKEKIRPLLEDFSVTDYVDCLEIRPKDCTKAKALQFLKGIEDFNTLIAFGDGDNDLDMLEMADYALCPVNGARAAKKAAGQIIDSIEEDGVGNWIETWLEKQSDSQEGKD